ncbi:MAG: insulinase family protein, partial [Dehalococcoidia bacterium]|nr:insulinase family protein [Dehalococcoidia bacterium]
LENTVDCLADMVRNSLFDPRELEKERQVIIEELNMVADSPQQLASLLIDATLWPGQPLGRDVAGTKETVRSITRAMQLDYLARNYGPNNLVVSVAGNVTPEETEALVERLLGDWEPTTPSPMAPAVNGQHAPRVNLLSKRTEQAQVCLAIPAYDQSHPDQFALDVLNIILGEGMSSRLFIELRENRGLCYDVNSYAPRFRDTGALTVSAGVDPKRVDDAVRAIIEELWRFRTAPVSSRELQKAKDLVKGRLLMRMEDSRAVASSFGRQELLMGHILTADELTEIIDAVDSDDILRVANDLFHEERLNLAIVGNFRSEDRFRALLHA